MPEAMKVKLTLQSQQLSKDELQFLIQAIRDCEQNVNTMLIVHNRQLLPICRMISVYQYSNIAIKQ